MKKQLFFSLILLLTCPVLKAELSQAEAKEIVHKTMRYIDPNKVLQQCNSWKELETELQAEGKRFQQKVEAKVKEGQEIQKQVQSGMLSDQAKEEKQYELMKLEQDIQLMQRQGQQALQKKYEQGQMAIYKEIEAVAKEFAAQNNLTTIFAGGFIYADETLDVSKDLAQAINKKHSAKKVANNTKATPKPATSTKA